MPDAQLALVTARLRIGPLDEGDIDAFVAYRRAPEVARYQVWDAAAYTRTHAEQLVEGQRGRGVPAAGEWVQLAIRRAADGVLLGDLALHTLSDQPDTYEIGCTLDPAQQGHGYATEAAGALLEMLFVTQRAHRVIASCDTRNAASRAALDRLGMRHESRLVEADWFKGEWTTVDAYALLRSEYRARVAS